MSIQAEIDRGIIKPNFHVLLPQRHRVTEGKDDDFNIRDLGEMERLMEELKK